MVAVTPPSCCISHASHLGLQFLPAQRRFSSLGGAEAPSLIPAWGTAVAPVLLWEGMAVAAQPQTSRCLLPCCLGTLSKWKVEQILCPK